MRWTIAAVVALGLISAGCRRNARSTVLSVFAASSLTEAFNDLERDFEKTHPNVDVRVTFAGSQTLRLQLEHGAPADVFASANVAHIRTLERAGTIDSSRSLADNELSVVVPKHTGSTIRSFSDLPKARRIVVGAPSVPVGQYTDQMLARAGRKFGAAFAERVRRSIVSREPNVRIVRAKVELGDADAAVVYRTDARSSSKVTTVPIPPPVNVRANYRIARVAASKRADLARAFIDATRSARGQRTLKRHGFLVSLP